MSLTLLSIVLGKRRFLNAVAVQSRAPLYSTAIAFFEWLAQQGGRPDLQVTEFGPLTGTSVVLSDSPCRVYGIFMHKGTVTASWFKGTDNATTAASNGSQDVSLRMGSTSSSQRTDDTAALVFPYGLRMVNGFTVRADTTGTGSTGSSTDGMDGVCMVGAA